MQEIKDSHGRLSPSLSPEWELFRIVQQQNWTELSHEPSLALLDMYRSIELTLNLQNALISPKLRDIADKYGKDLACRLVGLVIRVYIGRFPSRPEASWGAWRLRQTAEWLYESYTLESLRDLMYAFRRGQSKYRHDLAVIMNEYLEWRAIKLEEKYEQRCRAEVAEWPEDLKQKLPDRWFLGHLNQPNGNQNKNQNAA